MGFLLSRGRGPGTNPMRIQSDDCIVNRKSLTWVCVREQELSIRVYAERVNE